jgi:regulator of RNase E activity RraA
MESDRSTDIIDALSRATSAIVADALDRMGRRDQVLDPAIRPVWPGARVAGRIVPVRVEASQTIPEQAYDGEMSALDSLGPGDVPLYAVDPGTRAATWGELFSCGARGRGALGAIVDGYVRDAAQIEELGFPVFSRGFSPVDTLGRAEVVAWGVEAVCGGVPVAPGDYVVADVDGIVAVPADRIDDVLEEARVKSRLETGARDDLLSGMGVRAVWDKYGVL